MGVDKKKGNRKKHIKIESLNSIPEQTHPKSFETNDLFIQFRISNHKDGWWWWSDSPEI